jgi:hypothetical protein
MTQATDAPAPDGPAARPADAITAEAREATKIETAATLNEAQAAEAAKAAVAAEPAAAEATPAPEPERKVQKLPEWVEKKIADEAFQRREEARQRKAAEDRAKAVEEENKRLREQIGAATVGQGQPNPAPAAAPLAIDPADFDRAVAAEAARRAAEAKFNEDCNRIAAEGAKAFPDFDDALKNLGALGALNEQVLQTVIATGDGARLLYELGSDPAEAAKVLTLPPSLLAIELGKRSAIKPARAATAISKAPAPIVPLQGGARITQEPRDEDDDQTYFEKRKAQLRERRRA